MKTYLFNPFVINSVETSSLAKEYIRILEKINEDTDIPFEIASNIERYANLNIIVGEMVARYKYEVDTLKSEYKTKFSETLYLDRNDWEKDNTGKPPAISYFEAGAQRKLLEEENTLNKAIQNLTRFKNAYDSQDNKIQALKKKYDAVKYEWSNNV